MGEEIILNRKNLKMSAIIEEAIPTSGLAILTHGIGSNKDIKVLKTISKIFNSKGYTTIRFDTTNSLGKSEGILENATITNYQEDLEDVINWAKKQSWYKEPFILAGHSVGGMYSGLVAKNSPEQIKSLILISTMISGELSSKNYPQPVLDGWEKHGFLEWTEGGKQKKLKWQFVLDGIDKNLLKHSNLLTMPTLIISGENDSETPTKYHKLLYDKIPAPKEIKIIKNGEHLLDKSENLEEIKKHVENWISNLDN